MGCDRADDFQKRQDITTQQALPEFQNALKQKKQEALAKFTGPLKPGGAGAPTRQPDDAVRQERHRDARSRRVTSS